MTDLDDHDADADQPDPMIMSRLASLPATPPPELEGRTVAALRRRRLLERQLPRALYAWIAAAAAAIIAITLVSRGPSGPAHQRYLFLLYGNSASRTSDSLSADEYRRWVADLRARGRHVTGEELDSDSQTIGAAAPPASARLDSLEGFFVIEASDPAEARELARSCPLVRHGGSVIIRRIVPT